MNGFLYTLTLQEPVLANSLGGESNSAESLFYIPGGLVRGAAIQAFDKKKDAASDPDFRRLFLSGETRFLNAYPLLKQDRLLPIPLKYRKPKYFHSSDFGQIKAHKVHAADDIKQITVHTQRDAVRGRATSDAGAVYRYIALPAGMRLQGVVLASNKKDADKIEELLKGKTILLGKARTAGYGHAEVETHSLPVDWRESGQAFTPAKTFTLTLLSPAIVRDENGQASLDITEALASHLAVKPWLGPVQRQMEIVGGFNRQWGLPLPQVTTIAAGSVFTVTASVSADKLLKLEDDGIGERRAEGFGRVAINLNLPDVDDWEKTELELASAAEGKLAKSDPLAKMMLLRILRRDLDQQLLHAARAATEQYLSSENKTSVPTSQLSKWRVIVRDALETNDLQRLSKFMADSKGKAGWKKMERARIDFNGKRPRLTEWIESLLNDPDTLKYSWEKEFSPDRSIGNNSITMDKELNIEYRLRLLDAVLAPMAKKSGGENG